MPTAARKLTPSLEDYLEAILQLVEQRGAARVRDIAKQVGVGMPAVSSALKSLAKRGLVDYDPYQLVGLTDQGRKAARQVAKRHSVLSRFLTEVFGLNADVAEANACRMEHAMDDQVLDMFRRFGDFMEHCPRADKDWLESFHQFSAERRSQANCRDCLARAAKQYKGMIADQSD